MSQTLSSQKNSFQIDEFYIDLQADGKTISLLSEEQIALKPFPGLRPFKTSEFQLFKGRDGQAEELLKRLRENHFLAVIGSSGTGKSSLVRAALIPQLFGGFLQKAGSKWKIAVCRPGTDPIKNLSIALSSVMSGKTSGAELLNENENIEPLLRNSSYGLLEVNKILKQNENPDSPANLLMIIDQFEELFRFDRAELKKEDGYTQLENDFVQLLLKAASGIDANIYVILTMRSEFLGDCVKYRGLPEIINKSQYLVPQLSRTQLKEVIELPVIRAGKKVSSNLVEILINEIESEKLKENLDQLPILQHALMRTYAEAFKPGSNNTEMLYEHYKSIGGMKESLALHAEEVFDNLADKNTDQDYSKADAHNKKRILSKKQLIAKTIFQALTDSTSDQKGGRRPTELQNIYDIAETINADKKEVNIVLNNFRDTDTSFIMPPSNTKLYPGLMLDISHESLMRNWPDLKDWMKEETEAADLYKKLNDNREQNDRDHDTYIRGILLKELQNWKDSGRYNAAWAIRYQGTDSGKNNREEKEITYFNNLDYLKKCQKKVDQERIDEIKRREDKERRNRLTAAIALLAAIISITFGVIAIAQGKKAKIAIQDKAFADSSRAQIQIKRQIDSANFAIKQLENAKHSDSIEAHRKIDLANTQAEALRKIALANAETQAEKGKNKYLFDKVPEILQLVNAPFYNSGLMDSARRNMFVNSLVELKYNNNDSLQYNKLLNDLNEAVYIYDLAQRDPNSGLLEAVKFNNSSKSRLSDSMLHYVADNYFFYTHETILPTQDLSYSDTRSLSAISKSRTLFAVKLGNIIKIFKLDNDKLSNLKNISINADQPLYNDSMYYNEINNGPGTMTFVGEDTLIAFSNNKLYKINITEYQNTPVSPILIPDLNKVNNYERFYTSSLSQDGEKLAIDYRNYSIKIWNLNKIDDLPRIIKLDSLSGYVDSISFSFNSKKIIVKQGLYYKIVNIADTNTNAFIKSVDDRYLNFTPDNKYVIRQPRSGSNIYQLYDLEKNSTISSINFSEIKIDTFKNSAETLISLSPDWKKLFLKTRIYKDYQYNWNTYSFQRNDNDSIFYFARKINAKDSISGKLIKLNYLNNSIVYFNNDNLISLTSDYYNYTDSVKVWKKYENIIGQSQLNFLVNKISAVTKTEEEVVSDSQNLDSITDENYLISAGDLALQKDSRLLQKETLKDAKNIFERLAEIDPTKYLYDYRRLSLNYYTYYADTTERAKDLKKITAAEEILIKTNISDSLTQHLSSDYWNLSWYELFAKEYISATYHAERGFNLYKTNNGIITNVALGYLLSGQCKKADSVYKEYKGQKYNTDERTFTKSFLQDLDDLQDAGIITPDKKDIYEHVQKVRQFLNNEINTLDCSQ